MRNGSGIIDENVESALLSPYLLKEGFYYSI